MKILHFFVIEFTTFNILLLYSLLVFLLQINEIITELVIELWWAPENFGQIRPFRTYLMQSKVAEQVKFNGPKCGKFALKLPAAGENFEVF